MNDNEPKRPGLDFIKGFLAALCVALFAVILMPATKSLVPLIIGAIVLIIGGIFALAKQRPFIGIGIFAMLVVTPLLLIGSCFALFALG
jgi:hypothetical protein